jgi:predicted transcriptional regulator
VDVEVDDDADEVARQLAMLSPRAAQAVAAAAAADNDTEREAALDALDDSDEPINRGLLLKFLSSVKS